MRILSLLLALWLPAAAQVAPMLNLVVLEGEGATNNIRQRTAREPIVQVQDENHKPVAGAIVVFTLPSNGAGGAFANGVRTLTMLTDNQGQAVARGFRPTGQGQFQIRVSASHNGQTASTSITQTNAIVGASASTASAGISGKLIAIIAVAGAAVAGGAYYATHNGNGTAAPVTPSGTTIAAGVGSVGAPR
ncbi:MAG: hypothetical protein ABI759_06625 [Candidatus Solibacter sp.]